MKCKDLIILIFLFNGCRELVQDEFPEFEPVPTINSILIADSILKVHISLAGKIDTNQLEWVDNAQVILFVDGNLNDTLEYKNNGEYFSSFIAQSNKMYSCEINIPGYPTVFCSDFIPGHSNLVDIVHINEAGKDEEGLSFPAIQFTLINDTSKSLYYEVVIRLLTYGIERYAELELIADPVLLNEGLPIAVFSNDLIKTDSYTMNINYTTGSGNLSGTELYPLILELRSVSLDYYKYVKQLYLYKEGRYPDGLTGNSTALSLYSNVHGGYGIFAGYSSVQSDTIYPYKKQY